MTYLSQKIFLTSYLAAFLVSLVPNFSSLTTLLRSISLATKYRVGRRWLQLTILMNGLTLVFLSIFLELILLVTLRGYLSMPATKACGNFLSYAQTRLSISIQIIHQSSYLLSVIILLHDDGFLASMSSCEQDNHSACFHTTQITK